MAQQMYQSSYPSSESSREKASEEGDVADKKAALNEKDDVSSIRKA